jgi:hypothetical protein
MPVNNTTGTASWGTQVNTPATGPIIFYPRAVVSVKYVYNDDSEVTTLLVPSKVSVTRRPHHQAGTCEVEFNATAVPFDLKRLNGIFLRVYMGAMSSMDDSPVDSKYGQKYLEFAGFVDTESVKRSPDGTRVVLSARDLSSILRDRKPVYILERADGTQVNPTPKYSDTLLQAINRVLDWADCSDVFEIQDDSGLGATPFSTLTDSRGLNGYIPIPKHEVSAWDIIDHCAGVLAFIVHVELGKIVLRRPQEAYALPDDPKTAPAYSFIFGDSRQGYVNALEVDVTKKFIRNRKGVRLVTTLPGGRGTITSDFPVTGKIPPKHAPQLGATKQTKPRKVSLTAGGGVSNGNTLSDPPRDVFVVADKGIHSQADLDKQAEMVYRVRSQQELEGTLVTRIWDEKLFGLRNGDRFEVLVKPELVAELINRPDEGSQVAFLRRYFRINEQAARIMLAQIRGQESTLFYLRSITHDWDAVSGAKTTVDFINLIGIV